MKQKGWIEIETNYLTEAGEKRMFEGWNDGSDATIILNIIYILQMRARGSRISPDDILAIAKIMKGDQKRWLK
jgi:hypothetical protein